MRDINGFKYTSKSKCKAYYIVDLDESDDLKEFGDILIDIFDENFELLEKETTLQDGKLKAIPDSQILKSLYLRVQQKYPNATLIAVVDEYYNVWYANKCVTKIPTISYYLNNLIYDIQTKKEIVDMMEFDNLDPQAMANKIMTDTLTNPQIAKIMVDLKESDLIIGVCLEILGSAKADGEEVVLDEVFSKDIEFMKKALDMYIPSFWLADISLLKNTTFFKYYLDKMWDTVGTDIVYDIRKIDSNDYNELLELVIDKAKSSDSLDKLNKEIEICFR
jgi:hypothetical protein